MNPKVKTFTLSPENFEKFKTSGGLHTRAGEYLTVEANSAGVDWVVRKVSEAPDHPEFRNKKGTPLKVISFITNIRPVPVPEL